MNSKLETIVQKFNELKFLQGESFNQFSPILKTILFIHAINLQSNLRCTGSSKEQSEEEFELPQKWNEPSNESYQFIYKDSNSQKVHYIIHHSFNLQIIALTCIKEEKIMQWQFNQQDLNLSKLEDIQNQHFLEKYKESILNNIYSSQNNDTIERQKKQVQQPQSKIEEQKRENAFWNPNLQTQSLGLPFGNYGVSDLDPIPLQSNNFTSNPQNINIINNPNQGGNLIGPNNPVFLGNNPNQNSNPRIRFDPYGPEPGLEPFSLNYNDDFIPQGVNNQLPGFFPNKPSQSNLPNQFKFI